MYQVLGFDISSSAIGWAVLSIDGYKISYHDSGYIKPTKKGLLLEILDKTQVQIENLFTKYQPDYIGIEEIIKYMPDTSTATTIIKLATFNRMIGLSAYQYLVSKNQPAPQMCNVLAIRHALKFTSDLPAKSDMPELVAKHLNISFPYEYKKTGTPREENQDRADSIAVALYYAKILTGEKKLKKRKTKK